MNRLGVDVGGTFTDVILVDGNNRKVWATKVPTTPDDPSVGVLNGIRAVFEMSGTGASGIGFVGHGTTIATNLLVEGKGAKAGLLTTRGFRDVLEIRRAARHDRADLYDMFFDNPRPLVPRVLRREVGERIRADGSVQQELNVGELQAEVARLADEGVEALAICFMHSYRNGDHERYAANLARSLLPDAFITTSVDVNPEIFEYERASTTVINATLGPRCGQYLSSLESRVAGEGVPAPVHLMQSNGGLTRPSEAAQRPVTLLESGPAGGVTAAAKLCQRMNLPNAITGDVGGTTFDVSLIRNGEAELRQHTEIHSYTVRAPTIDIVSIGAGGGSIASVDAAGGIQVGPRSAGAKPGPACYGRGGTLPTVTDCNLVLGYLSADRPMGGYTLDLAAARRVIDEHLARPLGISVEEAARTVRTIANAHMAQAMRLITIERGYDPREFAYITFGGAGPVHAVETAEMLEVATVVVPPHPGLFSAFGMLVADMVHDFQSPALVNLEDAQPAQIEATFAQLEREARERMQAAGIAAGQVTLQRRADCRYLGQADSMTIDVPGAVFDAAAPAALIERFKAEHQRAWNFSLARPVILTNLRLRSVGAIGQFETGMREAASGPPRPTGTRQVMLTDRFETLPCYERHDLAAGLVLAGPAVIEEPSTSIVIGPADSARIDADGNLIIDLGKKA
jgi:N-methylhydantoinase A